MNVGKQCQTPVLSILQHLAKELSDKANEKETAIAEAQQVLQKIGPTRAKEFGKKVDAVVSVWTRVHNGCTEVKTVLHKYLPEVCVFPYILYDAVCWQIVTVL